MEKPGENMEPVFGWCVEHPDSEIGLLHFSFQEYRWETIERFERNRGKRPWRYWYNRGYRCVPVKIEKIIKEV